MSVQGIRPEGGGDQVGRLRDGAKTGVPETRRRPDPGAPPVRSDAEFLTSERLQLLQDLVDRLARSREARPGEIEAARAALARGDHDGPAGFERIAEAILRADPDGF